MMKDCRFTRLCEKVMYYACAKCSAYDRRRLPHPRRRPLAAPAAPAAQSAEPKVLHMFLSRPAKPASTRRSARTWPRCRCWKTCSTRCCATTTWRGPSNCRATRRPACRRSKMAAAATPSTCARHLFHAGSRLQGQKTRSHGPGLRLQLQAPVRSGLHSPFGYIFDGKLVGDEALKKNFSYATEIPGLQADDRYTCASA
jgi:hypothetical protein